MIWKARKIELKRFRRLAILTVCCAGCEDSTTNSTSPSAVSAENTSETSRQSGLSTHDVEILARLPELSSRWNRVTGPLVRDYLDPNVPARKWVADTSGRIGDLRAIHAELFANTMGIENDGVRGVFSEFASNYKSKLDALTSLHNAVAHGNQSEEQRANAAIRIAATDGQKMAESLLDRLRPYVDPNELALELRKKGKEIGELMQPRQ